MPVERVAVLPRPVLVGEPVAGTDAATVRCRAGLDAPGLTVGIAHDVALTAELALDGPVAPDDLRVDREKQLISLAVLLPRVVPGLVVTRETVDRHAVLASHGCHCLSLVRSCGCWVSSRTVTYAGLSARVGCAAVNPAVRECVPPLRPARSGRRR